MPGCGAIDEQQWLFFVNINSKPFYLLPKKSSGLENSCQNKTRE